MKISYLIFLLCIYFSSNAFAVSKVISVELNYSGIDGLTKSLEESLRAKISHSREFVINSGQRSELQLLITEDVRLKKIANHNQVSYKVNFISRQKITSVSTGSCWQEQISECAEQILRDAKITIRPNS